MSNKKNILVTGASGQLGMELRALAGKYPGYHFDFVSKEQLSITDHSSVENYFSQNSFDYCINCAAYTAVDKAESEPEAAFAANAFAAGQLSFACKKYHARFIHFSTDYVFDGNGKLPYKETDLVNPIGVYGASKLEGEKTVLNNNDQAIIIRTSWVYSSYGKNFVKTMMRLMNEKESIGVVDDQLGCPTYAADLAEAVMQIISASKNAGGIYNYCNEGIISWFEFALAIKNIIGSSCIVNPIKTAEYPTPAKRPHYSVLDTNKIKTTFGIVIPGWKEGLKKCITLLS